jgi:DNA-binding CsgD family transcriptional regulator
MSCPRTKLQCFRFREEKRPVPALPSNFETGLAPQLALADVLAMLRLINETCDPAEELSISARRKKLLAGLAELIDADCWLGGNGCAKPEDPCDSAPMLTYDGGWQDEIERMRVWGVCQNTELSQAINIHCARALVEMRTVTITRPDILSDSDFQASGVGQAWLEVGLDHFMISVFPLERQFHSVIALYRRRGRPAFTERDRTIVHLLWQQVEWLHRQEIDLPVGTKFVELSLRERQVLILLLGGGTRRTAAEALEISEHTVGDHMKAIYRKLKVRTRGELLAKFIAAGPGAATHLHGK